MPQIPRPMSWRVFRNNIRQFPLDLLVTGEPPYANAKVYSLALMLEQASNDLVVMSDSDIRVDSKLLRTVAAEFQDASLGVATCPYRAVPGSRHLVSAWKPQD